MTLAYYVTLILNFLTHSCKLSGLRHTVAETIPTAIKTTLWAEPGVGLRVLYTELLYLVGRFQHAHITVGKLKSQRGNGT